MSEREEILNELKDIAPELAKFKEEQSGVGFEVPPRYFSDLKKVLMQEIQTETEQKVAKSGTTWWKELLAGLQNLLQPKPALALATIAILIAVGLWFNNSRGTLQQVTHEIALNNEEVEAYVMANIDEFETDVLIDMYTETFQEESEDAITEDKLDEILQEMDDEEFDELWDAESFNE